MSVVHQGSDGKLRRASGKAFSLADEQKRANKELRRSMKKMLKEQKATDKKERKATRKSMKKMKGLSNNNSNSSTTAGSDGTQQRKTLGAIQETSHSLPAPKLYAAEEPGATATPMRVKHNPLRRPSLMNENVDGTKEGPLSPAVPKGEAARNGGKWKSKAWKTPSPAKYIASPTRSRQYTPRNTSIEYRGLLELDDSDADIFSLADGNGNNEGGSSSSSSSSDGGNKPVMGTASMLASITEGTEINPIHAAAQQRATMSPKTESSGFFSKYNDDAKANTNTNMTRPMLAPSPLGATTPLKKRGSWFSRKTPMKNPPLTPKSYGATEDALAVLPSPGGTFQSNNNTESQSPFSKAAQIMHRAKSFMTRASKAAPPQPAASFSAGPASDNAESQPLSPKPVTRKKSWFANTPLGKIRSKGSNARLKAANVEKIQKMGAFRY